MERNEIIEGLKEAMAAWDKAISIALSHGCTQGEAEEIVGKYFRDRWTNSVIEAPHA